MVEIWSFSLFARAYMYRRRIASGASEKRKLVSLVRTLRIRRLRGVWNSWRGRQGRNRASEVGQSGSGSSPPDVFGHFRIWEGPEP